MLLVKRTLTTWRAALAWDRAVPGGYLNYNQAMEQLRAGETVSRWDWPSDKRLLLLDHQGITVTGNLDLCRKTETWEAWEPTAEDRTAVDWAIFDPAEGWHADIDPIPDSFGRSILKSVLWPFGLRLRKFKR